eukprot:g19524.t1
MSDVPNQPHKKRLQLKIRKDVEPLEYDDQLFERPARMALGFLKRASWMLAGAFEMEYDVEKNSVTAGPKTAVLKPFWQKVVELHPTPQDKLWILACTKCRLARRSCCVQHPSFGCFALMSTRPLELFGPKVQLL